jgi:hypothetical protein
VDGQTELRRILRLERKVMAKLKYSFHEPTIPTMSMKICLVPCQPRPFTLARVKSTLARSESSLF